MHKAFAFLLALFCFYLSVSAQYSGGNKTQVCLLGTFHFDNPGLDVAQFESANVLSPKRQGEIEEVIIKLKLFNPTKIFIEATPDRQSYYDSVFTAYKEGRFKLEANEIFQLGFRLAKELNHPGVECVDYREAEFPFDSLMKVMAAESQTDLMKFMKQTIDSIEFNHNHLLKTSTIKQILVANNTQANRNVSVGMYFKLLKAGDKNNHIGSYLSSEWWRRNMVIYENILKRLSGNEERVLVIFGSAHTALLYEFMKYNADLEVIEAKNILK